MTHQERPPTERQLEILRVVVRAWQRGGPIPTVRDISAELEMSSPTGAYDQLTALVRKGCLTRSGDGRLGVALDDEHVAVILRAGRGGRS